jgi:hypothetical protein
MPAVFNRFGLSGYTDFSRASMDNWIKVFKRIKKKLTDIGFMVPIVSGWFFVRIGSEFNGSGFLRTLD